MRNLTHFRRPLARTLSTLLLLSAAACGSDGNPVVPKPTQPAGPAPVAEVELGGSEMTIPAGETLRILVSVRAADGTELTGRAVAWESSDPAIVTVDAGGNVTGVGEGTATVSATSEGKRAQALVHVGPPVVDAVRIDAESLTLAAGETRQLTATVVGSNGAVLADRVVTWVSSDPDKASVDAAGVVTARKAGTVLISAHAEAHEGSVVVQVTETASPNP